MFQVVFNWPNTMSVKGRGRPKGSVSKRNPHAVLGRPTKYFKNGTTFSKMLSVFSKHHPNPLSDYDLENELQMGMATIKICRTQLQRSQKIMPTNSHKNQGNRSYQTYIQK